MLEQEGQVTYPQRRAYFVPELRVEDLVEITRCARCWRGGRSGARLARSMRTRWKRVAVAAADFLPPLSLRAARAMRPAAHDASVRLLRDSTEAHRALHNNPPKERREAGLGAAPHPCSAPRPRHRPPGGRARRAPGAGTARPASDPGFGPVLTPHRRSSVCPRALVHAAGRLYRSCPRRSTSRPRSRSTLRSMMICATGRRSTQATGPVNRQMPRCPDQALERRPQPPVPHRAPAVRNNSAFAVAGRAERPPPW